jgi:hypothetical protein
MQGRRSMTKNKTVDLEAENAALKAQVASITAAREAENATHQAHVASLISERDALQGRVINK